MSNDIPSYLIDIIETKKEQKPFVLGVNGIDGSGKTFLCDKLQKMLNQRGYDVCRLSVDNFHNPKSIRYQQDNLAEAYYFDSINFNVFKRNALELISKTKAFPIKIQTKSHDLVTDKEDTLLQEIYKDTIILAEGVFLFKANMIAFYDLKIFLDVDFETIIERVKIRDLQIIGSEKAIIERYKGKYIPGQQLYFNDAKPLEAADIIIDNNDFLSPSIIKNLS